MDLILNNNIIMVGYLFINNTINSVCKYQNIKYFFKKCIWNFKRRGELSEEFKQNNLYNLGI